MDAHYYEVNVNWNKERRGMMCSPELKTEAGGTEGCIEVATPPEFPKGISGIWSPEHLFTAVDGKFLMTEILLTPKVTIADEKDREKAEKVLLKSEGACLISNSIKSKVTMNPIIEIGLIEEILVK